MSATATDKNLALILEMGGDPQEGYDPIPPQQYLAFLNKDIRITPSAQELLAWVRKWTIRARKGGRSPYASDGPKRPLRLKDAGEELQWQPPQVSRVWAELEDAGLVRKDEKDRLFLCGRVKPRRKLNASDSIEDELATMTEYERKCCELLPLYAWLQMKRLDTQTRRKAAVEYWEADQYCRRVIADAMGGAREWADDYRTAVLARYGIKIRRHEEKPAEPVEAVVRIEVKPPSELSVQNFSETEPVQATANTTYTENEATVPGFYPYEAEIDRDDRVSKCEPEPESGFSCEDLPTPKIEDEEPQQPAPAPAPIEPAPAPQAEKPREVRKPKAPVERESTRPTIKATGPIVAYVEKLFGKGQSPVILMKFETLAAEHDISPEAVTRFLLEKVEDKIRNNYPIKSAGALLQFAREDMAGWLAQNRREMGHSARQATPEPPPAVIPPAVELQELEMWLCERQDAPDADYTRRRIAELREQLGEAAPPPYVPPTKEEELAQLRANLRQYIDERGIEAKGDTYVITLQARIRKLKQELGTDAAGAAG